MGSVAPDQSPGSKSCTTRLPLELYRVSYPGTRTAYSPTTGLTAADTKSTFSASSLDEAKELRLAVEKQFTWTNRNPTPFISLFSDRGHAERWATKEPWLRTHAPRQHRWTLHIIDTNMLLASTAVYRLGDLVKILGVDIQGGARAHLGQGVICLHQVPANAITQSLDSQADIFSGPACNPYPFYPLLWPSHEYSLSSLSYGAYNWSTIPQSQGNVYDFYNEATRRHLQLQHQQLQVQLQIEQLQTLLRLQQQQHQQQQQKPVSYPHHPTSGGGAAMQVGATTRSAGTADW
ncbi:hypothetical protein MKZ38_005754 [Zalerion maritima]|uniref:DUF7587 domain-containing protein n=1 Tax=Zalerion maritima TaxID=339359 RepID=A0AAD5RK90_9PEZI|nr:hypothetical protein MKZ38_005754 [Zalerion maritima]